MYATLKEIRKEAFKHLSSSISRIRIGLVMAAILLSHFTELGTSLSKKDYSTAANDSFVFLVSEKIFALCCHLVESF